MFSLHDVYNLRDARAPERQEITSHSSRPKKKEEEEKKKKGQQQEEAEDYGQFS